MLGPRTAQPTRSTNPALVLALVAPFSSSSCAGDPKVLGPPGDIEWRSAHFAYHTRADDPEACPAVVDQLERHFAVIQEATGLSWPEGRVIDYYKYSDSDDFNAASPCREGAGACVNASGIHTPLLLHEHELVHAYFGALGAPPRILSEGVASALACLTGFYSLPLPPDLEWDQDGAPGWAYITGQALVSHLVSVYGWQAFRELYSSPWQARDSAEIEAHFERVYGESIEDVWANLMAGPEPMAGCLVPWECSAPALSAETPETPSYDCGGSPYRTLDVEQPGVVEIETEGTVGLFVECPAELDQPISVSAELLARRTFAQLPRGRYFMVTDGETTLTTRSLDTQLLGTQCEQLPTLSLEAGDSGTSWLFHPAESAYFLRLSLAAPKPVSVVVSGTGPVQACRSCELSADCVVVEEGAMLGATSELVLHFPAATTQSALAELIVLVAPE